MDDVRRILDELRNPLVWHNALSAEHCDRASLSGYLLQSLRGDRRDIVHAHVGECKQCTVAIDILRSRIDTHIGDALAALMGLLDDDGNRRWTAARWAATHTIASALQEMYDEGVSAPERHYVMQTIFHALEAFGAACTHADFDDVWPIIEALEEGSIDVCGDEDLSREFADHYGVMSERSSSAVLRCGLAYGIGELLERGEASKQQARRIAQRLIADPHPEAPVVLALLGKIRPEIRNIVSNERLRDAEADHGHLLRQVMNHADIAAATMSLGGTPKDRSLPAEFCALLELIHQREPLPGIAGLIGIRKTLKTIIARDLTLGAQIDPNPFVRMICDALFTPVLEQMDCPAFLATEASEVLRDKLPGPLALAMGDMLSTAPERVCQACFICVAEGMEEWFGGAFQSEVPEFQEVTPGRWIFAEVSDNEVSQNEVNVPRQLSAFGHAAASAATNNSALRPMLEWFNERMINWLEPGPC